MEAHHERTKAKYASNPDINTQRSRYNIHIIKPEASYKRESDNRIETAQLQADYHNLQRFVDSLPEEVKRQARSPQRSQDYQR